MIKRLFHKFNLAIYSIILVVYSLIAVGSGNADELVASYIHNNQFEELRQAITESKISPTYVFPSGLSLTEVLVTLGEVDLSASLIEDYWVVLKYTSPKILTAACLNDRMEIMTLLFKKGMLEHKATEEAMSECLSIATSEYNEKQIKLLKENGARLEYAK